MKKFILGLTSLIIILGSSNPHIIGNKDNKVSEYNKNNTAFASTITNDNTSNTSSNKNLSPTSSENKIEKTLKCSTNNVKFNGMLVHSLINDIVLKASQDSNINVTLNCVAEGRDKEKINDIFKEIELKIEEKNNQYSPEIYRKGENLMILSQEMKNIDYIKFNLIIEIPNNIKSLTVGNFGSVEFDSLKLDKIDISSNGNIKGKSILSKDCTLLSNGGVIEIDSLKSDMLYLRALSSIKAKEILSKESTFLANNGLIEVGNINSDTLYIRTHSKLKAKEITSKDCSLVTNNAVVEIEKLNCEKITK